MNLPPMVEDDDERIWAAKYVADKVWLATWRDNLTEAARMRLAVRAILFTLDDEAT